MGRRGRAVSVSLARGWLLPIYSGEDDPSEIVYLERSLRTIRTGFEGGGDSGGGGLGGVQSGGAVEGRGDERGREGTTGGLGAAHLSRTTLSSTRRVVVDEDEAPLYDETVSAVAVGGRRCRPASTSS